MSRPIKKIVAWCPRKLQTSCFEMFHQEEQKPKKDNGQNFQLSRFDFGADSQIDDEETRDWGPIVIISQDLRIKNKHFAEFSFKGFLDPNKIKI